jgi:hypothetical protein
VTSLGSYSGWVGTGFKRIIKKGSIVVLASKIGERGSMVIFFSPQRAKTLASIVRKGTFLSFAYPTKTVSLHPILLISPISLYGEVFKTIVKERFSPLICSQGERLKGSACLSLIYLLKTSLTS